MRFREIKEVREVKPIKKTSLTSEAAAIYAALFADDFVMPVEEQAPVKEEHELNIRNDKEFRKGMGQWFKEIRESIPAVDAGIFPHDDDDKYEQNN